MRSSASAAALALLIGGPGATVSIAQGLPRGSAATGDDPASSGNPVPLPPEAGAPTGPAGTSGMGPTRYDAVGFAAAATANEPPDDSPAPSQEPAALTAPDLDQALQRFAWTVPDGKIWDAAHSRIMSQQVCRTWLGKDVFNGWKDHPERRAVAHADVAPLAARSTAHSGGRGPSPHQENLKPGLTMTIKVIASSSGSFDDEPDCSGKVSGSCSDESGTLPGVRRRGGGGNDAGVNDAIYLVV